MPKPNLNTLELETTVELAVVLDAEAAAARTDVERARAGLEETRQVRTKLRERIRRFRAALAQFESEDAELAAKEEAEIRLLNARRRALFDIETQLDGI